MERTPHILVVDDHREIRELLAKYFAKNGLRVSVASGGAEAHGEQDTQINDATLSNDGRYVLFDSFAYDLVPSRIDFNEHVYLHDRLTQQTTRVSATDDGTPGNFWSGNSQISGDGHTAVFGTVASNLIPNDANGYGYDIAVARLSTASG